MKFIAERLPSKDELAQHISEIKAWPLRDAPAHVIDWVVSSESRAFLVRTSSGLRDDPDFSEFGLWLNGDVFYIALTQKCEGEFRSHVKVRWTLRSIDGLSGNEIDRSSVLNILKQALSIYGVFGASVKVASFDSEFDF